MSSKKSFIPYGKQHLSKNDIRAVVECLKSEFLTQGPQIQNFEKKITEKTGVKFAVTVSNGTAALHLLALALGLKKGDEVITTPISFLATSNSLLYAGLKPVFADVNPKNGNLTVETVKKKITKKTKAIFLTHLAGNPCDMKGFSKLAKMHKLILVEDSAHAFGAHYENKPVGNCRYSDATILSFHPVKHITTGEGGAVLTNNQELAEKITRLRSHGVTRDPKRLESNHGRWYYEMQELGFNYRMTDIQAALGISQIGRLDSFINARRGIAALYQKLFKGMPGIALPGDSKDGRHAYHIFPVRLSSDKLRAAKKQIFEDLFNEGVGAQVHYIPIASQPYYRKLGYSMKGLEGAQLYYDSTLSLPIFPALTEKQAKQVAGIFKKIIQRYI